MKYEAVRSERNKRRWTLRLNTDEGPDDAMSYSTFASKRAAQEWADRLNAAFFQGDNDEQPTLAPSEGRVKCPD